MGTLTEENAKTADTPEHEELWEDLLAFMEEGKIVPVVGPDLLTIPTEKGESTLYRVIAGQLARKYKLDIDLETHGELNDVVCAYLAQVRRAEVDDLYRPINDILKSLNPPIPKALRQLAAIRGFDLFVTTTFDGLMAESLNQERFGGVSRTLQLAYAPNLSVEERKDIVSPHGKGDAVVFHLFGRASASPDYAIHDEDVLEFVHTLQSGQDVLPKRLYDELQQKHLLVIGCPFPDWLGRFFIRMSGSERLIARRRKDFLVSCETTQDQSLGIFLEHFSCNTSVFPAGAAAFVEELHRRWSERHPAEPKTPEPLTLAPTPIKGRVFISYARQDSAAARALYQEVGGLGGDICWLDKEEIEPGNDWWEDKILASIRREARLILPIISKNTEERTEGVFRKEWREAIERARGIQGRDFIIPVIVDTDNNPDHYKLIPEEFRRFDIGWAPEGRPEDRLREKLVKEIRAMRREEQQ